MEATLERDVELVAVSDNRIGRPCTFGISAPSEDRDFLALRLENQCGFAIALGNQFRELLLGCVHTFRPSSDIRYTREVGS